MLNRKMLSAMEIDADKIDRIMQGHTESITGLKDDYDKAKAEAEKYKADADKLAEVQKELETAKKELDKNKNANAEYEKLKLEFENYKTEQAKKEQDAIKAEKFRELLKDIGLSEKGIKMAMKWQGVDGVEIDEDGKITNAKELRKSAKEDWAEYITETKEEGAPVPNPPVGGKPTMTREEIMKIKDRNERQKAIDENSELFGF